MFVVYKTINEKNGKSYIGFTGRGLERRQKQHLSSVRNNSNTAFHNAIRKYGKENFVWEVLWEGDDEDQAKNAEILLIAVNKTLAPNGYNMTEGGDGASQYRHSKRNRQKIKQASKQQWKDKDIRQKRIAGITASWDENRRQGHREVWKNEDFRKMQAEKDAKLTQEQVLNIYERVWAGEKGKDLAKEFGISEATISMIKHRRIWKHILPVRKPLIP